jgi:hypothetical protein
VAGLGEPGRQMLFHGISGVIGTECDSHLRRQGSHERIPDPSMGLPPHLTTFA